MCIQQKKFQGMTKVGQIWMKKKKLYFFNISQTYS